MIRAALPPNIRVEDFARADIAGFLDYWYGGEAASLAALGVDAQRLPSKAKMREMLEWNLERNAGLPTTRNPILSIRLDETTIGVHELTHLVPAAGRRGGHASAVMHGHIWNAAHRGRGVGRVSYVQAMQLFFGRFDLDCIRFESPAQNAAANHVKKRLGIREVGTGSIQLAMLRDPVATITYEVWRSELPGLVERLREVVSAGRCAEVGATGLPLERP